MTREQKIARIAARQHGVFSRAQAVASGFSRSGIDRKTRNRSWTGILPGVYRLAGSPQGWHQKVMAALLWAGPDAVASHRTAAALVGLDGCHPGIIELTIPRYRRPPSGVVLHTSKRIANSDLARIGPIKITSAARTLIDLGAAVEDDDLEIALHDALRRRLTSIQQLRRRLDALSEHGRPGPPALRRVIPTGAIPDTTFETKLLQKIRRSSHPLPIPQFKVFTEDGRFIAKVDFAYPEIRLAIECDSDEFHSEPFDRDRDAARFNDLGSHGWLVLIATARDIAFPQRLIEAISLRFASHTDAKRGQMRAPT